MTVRQVKVSQRSDKGCVVNGKLFVRIPGNSTAANIDFHVAIYRGSHNAYLGELASATRRRLAPFRRAQFEGRDRLARSHREHDAVVQAIQRAEAAKASAAMRDHIGLAARAWDELALSSD